MPGNGPRTQEVIILKGLPGSGKSTWAKAFVLQSAGQYKRINKDDLRDMLDAGQWSARNEKFILRARDGLIRAALDAGRSVIVDDTNLAPEHEARIRELAGDGVPVSVRFFDTPLEECIRRDAGRPKPVGERVIREMYDQFLREGEPAQRFEPPTPRAILCDLDGTLAIITGRNPYDTARCERDRLNAPVAGIVRMHHAAGYRIVLVSGREDRFRPHTERWLAKHGIEYAELLMRQTRDNRKDSIIKREIYEREIAPRYTVEFVLDDRDQVVEMWREIGLVCLQVAPGDF